MASTADARTSETGPSENSSGLLATMRLGKYRIERQLGAGGMGTVFLALDSELRRTVALKVLPKERASNPQLVRRFKSEGQSAARLEHENIVKVFEAGEIDGHLYIALEYIDGVDVQELVRKRGFLPVRRSIEIVRQVAAALQHAFERGIVHRDIKPSNLLIRKDGVVKLADMGLARAIDETIESSITHAGMTVGTVDYISPEQGSDSKQADIRSDLYSLGCSWFHMLTGEVPYPDGTAIDKLRAHSTARIPDPRQYNDRIPAAVVAVLQRMMSKKPDNRYQTPLELIDDLKQPSLLHRETGAADIAGLALSASEVEDEERVETGHGAGVDTLFDPGPSRRSKPGKSASPVSRRDARRTDSAEESEDEPPHPDVHRPDIRRAETKRNNARQPDTRSTTKPDGKTKPVGKEKRTGAAHDSKSARDLPPRSERPGQFAVSHSVIDPATLKAVGFGLVVLAVVSAIGWLIWRASQDPGGDLPPSGANPFARGADDAPLNIPPVVKAPSKQGPVAPPPTEITNFRPADPFPGVRDSAADAGVADVPRWVYEARERTRPSAQTVIVDPTGSDHRTAADALNALPSAGGILEFRGRGPFAIDELTVKAGQDVLLRAADGSQPVLHLADAASQINVRGGSLELNGLHLVASGRGRSAANPLINLESATILVRNGSITLADPADASVAAVRLAAPAGENSRCVLENVLLRGNNLSAATLDGPGHGLVVGNCLIAAGDAPVVTVLNPSGDGLDPVAVNATVELLASFAMSRNSAFACVQPAGSPPPNVHLRVRKSILEGDGSAASAVRLSPWPETLSSVLDQPRATGLHLSSEQSIWAGWSQLTLLQSTAGGDPVSVVDDAQWLQFWRTPLSTGSNIAPLNPPPESEQQSIDAASVQSRLTQRFGPDIQLDACLDGAVLPQLPASLIARLVAESARPRVPENLDAAFSGPVVTFDLNKNGLKLNRLLNGPECPDGARVILTASKKALIEPVVLQGKSLRLEFDSGNEPVTFEPATRAGIDRPQALFRVENGRLDLVNARLRIPSSETSSYPLRLLQVVDGSFVVRRCILLGQFGAGSQDVPTIEWDGGGDPSRFGLIEDSLIAGRTQAIGGRIQGQLLEINNSIAVSGGDVLRFVTAASDKTGTVHISRSTLSAAAAFFRIEPPADGPAGPLQVFVDDSIYGPPTVESNGLALLVQQARGDQTAPLDWWESRTAISDRIQRFRVADDSRTTPQAMDEIWLRGWGPDHINNTVSGPLSVILAVPDIDLAKPRPTDFQLDSRSLAATAAADGGPLGARIESVGPAQIATAGPAGSAAPVPKSPVAPRKGNRIDF